MQALAYIGDDLHQAGYLGITGSSKRLAGVAGPADPVAIPVGGDCGANFSVTLDRAVEGRNNRYDLACPANGTVVSGSDVLVVRRLAAGTSSPEIGRLQAALTLDAGYLFRDGSPSGTPPEIRDVVTSVYYVAAGEGSPPALRRKTLVKGGTYGRFVPPGFLVYARENTLFAARFDPKRVELTGPAVPVLEGVAGAATWGSKFMAYSSNGTLI